MTDTVSDAIEFPLSADALREWTGHVESVMRGIVHALNNRAAALSAVLELSREPGDEASAVASILSSEMQRVAELTRVARSLGAQHREAEAIDPDAIADEALAILRYHAAQRERRITIDAAGAPPVRVPRWMLVRALVALVAAAGERTGDPRAPVAVSLAEEDGWLVARSSGTPGSAAASPYATELARAMGGAVLERECGFRVPTLAAVRRREGR